MAISLTGPFIILFLTVLFVSNNAITIAGNGVVIGNDGKKKTYIWLKIYSYSFSLGPIQCGTIQCSKDSVTCSVLSQSNAQLTTVTTTQQCSDANSDFFSFFLKTLTIF